MPFDSLLTQPMRTEVTRLGLCELRTPADVDQFLAGTTGSAALVFVNSVCGCAAGNARPALAMTLGNGAPRPAKLATVFAGQDLEATARFRSHFPEFPASSPSVYLLKEGRAVAYLPRLQIEGRTAEAVAADLKAMMHEYFSDLPTANQGEPR